MIEIIGIEEIPSYDDLEKIVDKMENMSNVSEDKIQELSDEYMDKYNKIVNERRETGATPIYEARLIDVTVRFSNALYKLKNN